jgi:hypothetical protein
VSIVEFEDYARQVNLLGEDEIGRATLIAYFLVKQTKVRDFTVRDLTMLWGKLDVGQPNVSRLTKKIGACGWFPRSVTKGHFRLHSDRVQALDARFPELFKQIRRRTNTGSKTFVDDVRIRELQGLSGRRLDPSRLVRICEEINMCYENGCLMAVALLARTIINHVPPVFGFGNFSEVANNYGGAGKGRSFKKVAQKLEESARNIGDMIAHETMRRTETLPSPAQIDFSQELDVLLGEVGRVLREDSTSQE